MTLKEKMTAFLLKNANPSIRLRVRKEILGELPTQEQAELHSRILQERIPKFLEEKQLPNGWIGRGFHGSNKNAGQYDNQETATKYLGEKGLCGTKLLDRAMDAFVTVPLTDPCYETHGKLYSEFEIPAFGQNIIRCACIARAGYAPQIDITPQIDVALQSFRRVTEADSILDVTRPAKNLRLFKEGERWPCRYHLETLAFTDSWKSDENFSMLAKAFCRLMRTDRPEISSVPAACWVGHAVGPLWYYSEGYSLSANAVGQLSPDGVRRMNLEKVEWLSRCGLYAYLPALRKEVDFLLSHIDENGICRVPFYENEFRGWGPYAGLQLEEDWRSKLRRCCDVTFRALLILHYAKIV
ncbi:MAG: hypothetical protein IJD06_03525 [Clostridia bacterium]|nr:hypothetical protein [Clostridia bacterium]